MTRTSLKLAQPYDNSLGSGRPHGEHVGLVPYGFHRNGNCSLAVDDAEMLVIQRMKCQRRRGASYQAIADRFNAEGVESRRGTWSKSSVRALVNDHLRSR